MFTKVFTSCFQSVYFQIMYIFLNPHKEWTLIKVQYKMKKQAGKMFNAYLIYKIQKVCILKCFENKIENVKSETAMYNLDSGQNLSVAPYFFYFCVINDTITAKL